jgi:hypothetical protein
MPASDIILWDTTQPIRPTAAYLNSLRSNIITIEGEVDALQAAPGGGGSAALFSYESRPLSASMIAVAGTWTKFYSSPAAINLTAGAFMLSFISRVSPGGLDGMLMFARLETAVTNNLPTAGYYFCEPGTSRLGRFLQRVPVAATGAYFVSLWGICTNGATWQNSGGFADHSQLSIWGG